MAVASLRSDPAGGAEEIQGVVFVMDLKLDFTTGCSVPQFAGGQQETVIEREQCRC